MNAFVDPGELTDAAQCPEEGVSITGSSGAAAAGASVDVTEQSKRRADHLMIRAHHDNSSCRIAI